MLSGQRLYADASLLSRLAILSMMLEAFHIFVTWLIVRRRSNQDPRLPPPLLDLTKYQFSRILAIRQYCSGLLNGLLHKPVYYDSIKMKST